jgi:acyl carrier protein
MRERVKAVMADVLGCMPEDIPEDANPDTLADWDSLRHLELMLALETEFHLRLTTEAMSELVSLHRITDYLGERAGRDRT